jgi:DNA-binding XRE family transcriptional regulator
VTPEEHRQIREELGWSQAKLAEELGVALRTIVNREGGHVPITRETELAMRQLQEQTAEGER